MWRKVSDLVRDPELDPYETGYPIIGTSQYYMQEVYSKIYLGLYPKIGGGKIGSAYLMEDKTVAKVTSVPDIYSTYKKIDSSYVPNSYKTCSPFRYDLSYLASDEFTNESLIGLYLYQQIHSPFYLKHYDAGTVGTHDGQTYGINITEFCDLGTLKNPHTRLLKDGYVQPHHINNILKQILVSIDLLQGSCGFIHSDLKAGNIFLKDEPVNISYGNVRIRSPYTCKIADYGKSSITIDHKIRLYNSTTPSDFFLTFSKFRPEVDDKTYTINRSFNYQVNIDSRHAGIPYYKSFDFYTIILSLLTDEKFNVPFFSSRSLRKRYWDPLWTDRSDVDDVELALNSYLGTDTGINEPIDMLKGKLLKCNVVSEIISTL